ncbi:MAG: hypothetical protein GF375_04230 [Candidatus Omnitrophica bacterium]|nr:hypothetical protein [Candidatus Omnitrophota bacterium]MBD3269253.1 hypothetical protein [Candidatus Omnitrophota bacterium]
MSDLGLSRPVNFIPLRGSYNNIRAGSYKQNNGKTDDLWWPPNKGILYKGEQKLTREKLISEFKSKQNGLDPEQEEALREACKDFESFFLYYLLKTMDKTVDRSEGLLGESRPMQFYREMFYENIADRISAVGMGLQKTLYNQLTQFLLNKTYK